MMNKSMSIRAMILLAIIVGVTPQTQADLITFTHQGRGDATLDDASLGVVDFTVTAYGDTDDRIKWDGVGIDEWQIPHTSASISIAGAEFDFLISTATSVSFRNAQGTVLFRSITGSPDDMGLLLFAGPRHIGELNGWDMLSSIGPISGEGRHYNWDTTSVNTTGGVLSFADGIYSPATFTAIVVPEPATLLLLGLGGIALLRGGRQGV